MAKKSFFERLTGATKEEIFQPKVITRTKDSSTKTKPDKKIQKPVKTEEEPQITTTKEEWPPEEEGQLTIDVYQTDADIVIKSTIAGVKPEDIDIAITNEMITIKGVRQKDESIPRENYYYQELYWGPFSRSVILPVDVDADKTRASMKNGILTIHLPKTERLKTKTIKIKELE